VEMLQVNTQDLLCQDAHEEGHHYNTDTDTCHFHKRLLEGLSMATDV